MEIHPENTHIFECLQPLIQKWMEEVINHGSTLEFKHRATEAVLLLGDEEKEVIVSI